MRTFDEIKKELTELKETNQKEMAICLKNIEQAEQSIEDAQNDLMVAENEINVDAYNTAKNNIWTAQHSKELFLKQKEKLEANQLIPTDKYNQLLAEIRSIADSVLNGQYVEAKEIIQEVERISEDSSRTWKEANELLHTLQYDIYKDQKGYMMKNGQRFTIAEEYKNQDTVHHFYNGHIRGTSMASGDNTKPVQTAGRYWGC